MHINSAAQGLNQLPRRQQRVTILRRASIATTPTIAVMSGTLPAEWRFALWATHPTSPLSVCQRCNDSQRPRRNTAPARRHATACERKCHLDQRGHAVRSAPYAPRRWRIAAVQPTQHHRFAPACRLELLVCGNGGVPPLPDAEELHSQCFASVSQCASAQTLVSARLRIVLG